jgi:lipoprotein-releasing system permease protein
MRYEFTIALRYLWAARKQLHTAFLSIISMLGLAMGVATLIISLALLSGLQGRIKSRLIASSPHLLIEPSDDSVIRDDSALLRAIAPLHPRSAEPVISGIAWASNRTERSGRPVLIRSYLLSSPPAAEHSFGRDWALRGGDPHHSIFLTHEFASTIGLFLDDDMVVVAPRTRLTPFGAVPVWKKYKVTRLVMSEGDEHSPEAFLPYDEMSALFFTDEKPTSIEVWLRSIGEIEAAQATIARQFPSVVVKTWKEVNRPLFLALRLEKVVMFATISLIIFVAALNLISSLSMLIVEKRPRVGILRTLGASERSILLIFLAVGLLIGIGGTILGNVLGLGVSWAAERYQLVPLPGEIYYVSHVPFSINLTDVVAVNIVAIVLSMLATWYPARAASRLDPITAIREE